MLSLECYHGLPQVNVFVALHLLLQTFVCQIICDKPMLALKPMPMLGLNLDGKAPIMMFMSFGCPVRLKLEIEHE